jgi:hypothetical protein
MTLRWKIHTDKVELVLVNLTQGPKDETSADLFAWIDWCL